MNHKEKIQQGTVSSSLFFSFLAALATNGEGRQTGIKGGTSAEIVAQTVGIEWACGPLEQTTYLRALMIFFAKYKIGKTSANSPTVKDEVRHSASAKHVGRDLIARVCWSKTLVEF